MDITIFINENSSRRMDFIQARTKNELVSSSPGFLSSVKDNFIAVLLNRLHTGPLFKLRHFIGQAGFSKVATTGDGQKYGKKKRRKKKKENKWRYKYPLSGKLGWHG